MAAPEYNAAMRNFLRFSVLGCFLAASLPGGDNWVNKRSRTDCRQASIGCAQVLPRRCGAGSLARLRT